MAMFSKSQPNFTPIAREMLGAYAKDAESYRNDYRAFEETPVWKRFCDQYQLNERNVESLMNGLNDLSREDAGAFHGVRATVALLYVRHAEALDKQKAKESYEGGQHGKATYYDNLADALSDYASVILRDATENFAGTQPSILKGMLRYSEFPIVAKLLKNPAISREIRPADFSEKKVEEGAGLPTIWSRML